MLGAVSRIFSFLMQGSKKPKVFILMPFSAKFDVVYKLGIKAACEECGAVAERVDEQIFSESIVERIYSQIENADLLIADMSNRNPNVFYEVGYAHAKSRKVVLVTKKAKDIPFDLKAYPHVIYGDDVELLRTELVRRIRFFLQETKAGRTKVEPAVLVYNGGKPVALTNEIQLDFRLGADRPEVTLDFHVPDVQNLGAVRQKFAIITSDFFTRLVDGDYAQATSLPDGRLLFQSKKMKMELLPGEWFKYSFRLDFKSHVVNRVEDMAVRVFTNFGPVDTPFRIRMLGVQPYREDAPMDEPQRGGVFNRLVTPSPQLATVVGNDQLSRTELTKRVWDYIKKHHLQDKRVKTLINADEKLKVIFNGKMQVSMFEMTKLLSAHLR